MTFKKTFNKKEQTKGKQIKNVEKKQLKVKTQKEKGDVKNR